MEELKVKTTYKKRGVMDDVKVRAFIVELGDKFPVGDDEHVVDKDELFSVLDKASQPIKKKTKTDSPPNEK